MLSMENESLTLERILMTVDTVGGVWNYAVELTRGLASRGVDVAIATMGPLPDKNKRKQLSDLKNVELFESSYKLEWMDDPWEDVEEATEWLLEMEILVHPDIIHLNGFVHGALPWHSPVVIAGHSCVCSWYEEVKKCKVPLGWQYYQKKVSEGLKGADCVVAPSNWMLKKLKKYYGDFERFQVIYNGRNSTCVNSSKKEHLIFSAGRIWDEGKNIKGLMAIAPKLNWPLFIAGDYRNCEFKQENVDLLGSLSSESVLQWISKASIFALPSIYEPFGLSILEAGIGECALVLGDIESLREIWADAAIYVKPDDTCALEDAINELINNEIMCLEYGQRAYRRALQFSSETMIMNYLTLYNSLLRNKSTVNKNI